MTPIGLPPIRPPRLDGPLARVVIRGVVLMAVMMAGAVQVLGVWWGWRLAIFLAAFAALKCWGDRERILGMYRGTLETASLAAKHFMPKADAERVIAYFQQGEQDGHAP